MYYIKIINKLYSNNIKVIVIDIPHKILWGMNMEMMKFLVLSIISEALWEGTKLFWQDGKLSIDRVGALIFSEILCLSTGMDF